MFRKGLVLLLLGLSAVLALGLGCQPAQPVPLGTPKPAEKAVATPTKPAEKGAAATPAKATAKPIRGGTLRFGLSSDEDTLDPQGTTGGGPATAAMDLLVGDDRDMNINKENGLAKDWTVSADGKAITFKLREGVKFQDGTDFDAAAVKFNIERVKDPATKATYASNLATVASAEVLDNLTVRLNLKQPDPNLLSNLTQTGLLIVSPAAVKKYGQDFGRNPVGSGPFQFVEWVQGDRIVSKRFEGYWGKDKEGNKYPYLDQVVFKVFTDQTTAIAALRTGQIDLLPSVPSSQLPIIKGDPNLTYVATRQPQMNGLYLNTGRPPFDNKALRQAVALALDREGLAGVLGEGATVQASIFHPMNVAWGADPKIGGFPSRDLAKARAKLAEAGYPDGGGLKVSIPTASRADDQLLAQVLKANLAEIGIQAEIEVLGAAAFTDKVRIKRDYQIANIYSSGGALADPGTLFGFGFRSGGSRNYYNYSNPKVDEAIDKAGAIYNQKERMALYNEAARMIADDMPWIPIYVGNNTAVMNKKVQGLRPSPVAGNMKDFKEVWLAQ